MTGDRTGPDMGIRLEAGAAVIAVPAEIDVTTAGDFQRSLDAATAAHEVVVVDLSATTFIDSGGIGVLVTSSKRARAAGGEVRLVMGGPTVRRVFELTGVDSLVRVYGSVAEALTPVAPGRN